MRHYRDNAQNFHAWHLCQTYFYLLSICTHIFLVYFVFTLESAYESQHLYELKIKLFFVNNFMYEAILCLKNVTSLCPSLDHWFTFIVSQHYSLGFNMLKIHADYDNQNLCIPFVCCVEPVLCSFLWNWEAYIQGPMTIPKFLLNIARSLGTFIVVGPCLVNFWRSHLWNWIDLILILGLQLQFFFFLTSGKLHELFSLGVLSLLL